MVLINDKVCDGCGTCVAVCPENALLLPQSGLAVDKEKCSSCGNCVQICPVAALVLQRK